LAGDVVDAVSQENHVIVHRRQAASHSPVFAARQRYVKDVVAPPTVLCLLQDSAVSETQGHLPQSGELRDNATTRYGRALHNNAFPQQVTRWPLVKALAITS
ncbi:hypothetical protein, partial [Pseudomonas viridiflava]|nr:hypothetical protein [Pseudomonas viridiflava]